MASIAPRRGPAVLVTDSREAARKQQRPIVSRIGTGALRGNNNTISVDGILQYTSDIPSALKRGPPDSRPSHHSRTPSGRHPLDPKLTGRLVPQHIPSRTSKVSEKLVILPETDQVDDESFAQAEDFGPPRDDEIIAGKRLKGRSYAESLPKARRAEKLPRVTAYGTAQAYKLRPTAEFLKTKHGARTKLYDDCLYVVYQLPLLPGLDGYRVRSSPIMKSPGGKSLLDEEIERIERRERHVDYYEEAHHFEDSTQNNQESSHSPRQDRSPDRERVTSPSIDQTIAEVFVFSYGVAVFWNLSERQEKDILADLTFSSSEPGVSLATRPLSETDFETEEFHFEYNSNISRPRVMADMFTLRSHDHMIKLAISHAIAQSTKLSHFEERMERTMLEAQHAPRTLALTGRLGMKREDVVKILGRLFTSRVNVNLSSNILDVPNFFWEDEPTLYPLYLAVREYLEIKPRIQVLNERCRVFLDLAEILSDAIADKKMTHITWIIIVLIVISIFVTCSEVFIRFGLLQSSHGKLVGPGPDVLNALNTTMHAPSAGFTLPSNTRSIARVGLVSSWVLLGTSMLA
ncbi:YagE family protein-like protein [Microthyrium microscopicum]|uniref:YagE family protein-like protein n=1 Tax=Microthyrium microscopicum TaxID=703497 RepID=A0A6A6UAZ3_9PEZI|nr:YagE family protein-like protein [Microthyrium microscopicum]